MFEKYVGRKNSPKVEARHGSTPESASKVWQERVGQSSEFAEWFSGSVVSDGQGNPVPVFHGTRGAGNFDDVYGNNVREFGVHFGTIAASNNRFEDTFQDTPAYKLTPDWAYSALRDRILKSPLSDAEKEEELKELDIEFNQKRKNYDDFVAGGVAGGETIYPVFLRIVNPVRMSDPGSFTDEHLDTIKKDLIKNSVTREQVTKVKQAPSIEELRKVLIEFGYDGVVYGNIVEGRDGDSYIPIVGPEQIRSAISGPVS